MLNLISPSACRGHAELSTGCADNDVHVKCDTGTINVDYSNYGSVSCVDYPCYNSSTCEMYACFFFTYLILLIDLFIY